jgi:hypothetical protein
MIEVKGMPTTSYKSMHPNKIVLLDSLGSEVARPSFCAMRMRSWLSSSLSQARSCPCSSMVTACEGDEALRQSTSKSKRHNKEGSPGKYRHRVKTHLADDDAWLEKDGSVPA